MPTKCDNPECCANYMHTMEVKLCETATLRFTVVIVISALTVLLVRISADTVRNR